MQTNDVVYARFSDDLAAAARAHTAVRTAWNTVVPCLSEAGRRFDAPMFDALPYLFVDAFPAADPGAVAELAVAVRLLISALIAQDAIIDGEPPDDARAVVVLRASIMLHEAYARLYQLFPAGSPFWQSFATTLARSTVAYRNESEYRHRWRDLDEEAVLTISCDKSAMVRIVPAALAELAGDERPHAPIAESLADYHLAFQLVDDLVDWRRDALAGAPTFPLVRIHAQASGALELAEIGRALYGAGHAEETIARALALLDRADARTSALAVDHWRSLIAKQRATYERLRGELAAGKRARR
jgi:hypothetical protein